MEDTIAAISTVPGQAGIGIVKISGPEAIQIGDAVFRAARGGFLRKQRNQSVKYGVIADPETDEGIDECLALVMRGPHSYTAEDVVELSCHSGILVTRKVLEAVLSAGARLAEPGEFTKRAFMNGRIDLSQAEAVIEVVQARTSSALTAALSQLGGRLGDETRGLKSDLLEISAQLEAAVDFSDEDIALRPRATIISDMRHALSRIDRFLQSAKEGRVLIDGVRAVIVGRPNVGKSSLLNAFLGEARAIVTEEPGTTRDIIEETLMFMNIPLRLTDTAGIRTTTSEVEMLGVEKAKQSLQVADLVMLVLDGSEPLRQEDHELLELTKDKRRVLVLNKADLPLQVAEKSLKREGYGQVVVVSATERIGLKRLEAALGHLVFEGDTPAVDSLVIPNVRQVSALSSARRGLVEAIRLMGREASEEIVIVPIKECIEEIGQIVGEATSEDVLERIFARFCVGK